MWVLRFLTKTKRHQPKTVVFLSWRFFFQGDVWCFIKLVAFLKKLVALIWFQESTTKTKSWDTTAHMMGYGNKCSVRYGSIACAATTVLLLQWHSSKNQKLNHSTLNQQTTCVGRYQPEICHDNIVASLKVHTEMMNRFPALFPLGTSNSYSEHKLHTNDDNTSDSITSLL